MTAAHTVTVELDGDGTPGLIRFACTGGPADECHQWCAEGCEEQCDGMPIRLWSPGQDAPELVAQAPAQGHRWEPMPPDGASCRLVDWLDATGDWRDTYDGEDYDAPQPLRPGTHVIAVYWDGDNYTWHYAADDVEPAIPGRPL